MCGRDQALHKFLSTLSSRRATLLCHFVERVMVISIHALLAESDAFAPSISAPAPNFYPRSPRGERRTSCLTDTPPHEFLSTLSSRRATKGRFYSIQINKISIHALLAESDSKKQQKIGSFVAELAILPLQYALSLDLSKYFRRYSSVFEKLFGAKVPEF